MRENRIINLKDAKVKAKLNLMYNNYFLYGLSLLYPRFESLEYFIKFLTFYPLFFSPPVIPEHFDVCYLYNACAFEGTPGQPYREICIFAESQQMTTSVGNPIYVYRKGII